MNIKLGLRVGGGGAGALLVSFGVFTALGQQVLAQNGQPLLHR